LVKKTAEEEKVQDTLIDEDEVDMDLKNMNIQYRDLFNE